MRRLLLGALFAVAVSRIDAQVIERPVPFDSAGSLMVMTPAIAAQAGLRPPWWPVAGDFREARIFTANDSTYVLAVTRPSGVVERYSIAAIDRDAIRATVSKLPPEALEKRNNARNAFVRGQTVDGLLFYAPAFATAIANDGAAATAGYLVVAGGTFFAASEISRRMFISRPMNDLAFNLGHNGSLAGWATMYLLGGERHTQATGAFVGGLAGAALGLKLGRGMTESDAVGAAFGSDVGALIGWGTTEALRGERTCSQPTTGLPSCGRRLSDKAEVALILASGIIGYPLGVLYPRNASYNVTPGDIQTLWPSLGIGVTAAAAFISDNPSSSAVAATLTGGAIIGIIMGDRVFVRRYDHTKAEGGQVTLGTIAGGLMGAGVGYLTDTNSPDPHVVYGLASAGALLGAIATESYITPKTDAGRRRVNVTFNPGGVALLAARAPGNHSVLNVSF
ncbi:MAG TPA: hypothetical protein VGO75_10085 [Gemmatimonadaceae bacterium]|nr:hypothetical protein [Gemmatimonadaceae bacterium]